MTDRTEAGRSIRKRLKPSARLSGVKIVGDAEDFSGDRAGPKIKASTVAVSVFEPWNLGEIKAGREMRAIPSTTPRARLSPSLARFGSFHNVPISYSLFSKYILSASEA